MTGKCNAMHFCKHDPKQVFTKVGQQLQASSQEKDLGALVEESLKSSAQCARAAAKVYQVFGQLLRGCTRRDPKNLIQLF